jgi:hypothetical protein
MVCREAANRHSYRDSSTEFRLGSGRSSGGIIRDSLEIGFVFFTAFRQSVRRKAMSFGSPVNVRKSLIAGEAKRKMDVYRLNESQRSHVKLADG